MSALQISLLIIGIVCVVLSYVLSEKIVSGKEKEIELQLSEEQKKYVQSKIDVMIEEQLEGLEEKTEITLDKVSNRKIMELSEYSDTVLADIKKNHDETVFLYDMLNEKTKEIKLIMKEAAEKPVKVTRAKKAEKTETVEVAETQAQEVPKETTKKTTRTTKTAKATKEVKAEPVVEAAVSNTKVNFEGTSNSNNRILDLHNQGKSNIEIAKELNLGIGEVKLVIDLYKGMK
ncbi:MAG: hypothetical protein IKL73_03775 [Lachnospiraceae bacterium]|nr:hypothetical protein [Lachnospiraceae bacterium]